MNRFPPLLGIGLAIALPSAASSTSVDGGGALRAGAAIDVRVVVPKVLELRLLDHPQTVQVSAADAANGQVVVSGPRIALVSNARSGYVVQAAIRGPFTEASIEGLPQPVHVDSSGARVPMPAMVGQLRPQPFRVRYRLTLRENTPPGTYAWPISLSLQAP
ncbi:MAG TPA: hypothetical protein VLY46_15470 [Usitatibacter sp.]|nr:hypothetical protein [Usitatibacter sp.]